MVEAEELAREQKDIEQNIQKELNQLSDIVNRENIDSDFLYDYQLVRRKVRKSD